MEICISSVKEILANGLKSFRDINPVKHSFTFIAKQTNNSSSFVERAAKNALGDSLDSKKILSLTEFVLKSEDKLRIINYFANKFIKEESSIFKNALYAKFIAEKNSFVPAELDNLLKQESIYLTYLSISVSGKVTKNDISTLYGEKGITSLNKLLDAGHIVKSNNYFTAKQKLFSPSFETMKENFQNLSKLYQPAETGKGTNFVHVVSNTTNLNGLKELKEEHRRHLKKVIEIKNKNIGDIPFYDLGMFDLLPSDNNLKKEGF